MSRDPRVDQAIDLLRRGLSAKLVARMLNHAFSDRQVQHIARSAGISLLRTRHQLRRQVAA